MNMPDAWDEWMMQGRRQIVSTFAVSIDHLITGWVDAVWSDHEDSGNTEASFDRHEVDVVV
jgi:hypothetical protein